MYRILWPIVRVSGRYTPLYALSGRTGWHFLILKHYDQDVNSRRDGEESLNSGKLEKFSIKSNQDSIPFTPGTQPSGLIGRSMSPRLSGRGQSVQTITYTIREFIQRGQAPQEVRREIIGSLAKAIQEPYSSDRPYYLRNWVGHWKPELGNQNRFVEAAPQRRAYKLCRKYWLDRLVHCRGRDLTPAHNSPVVLSVH